MRIMVQIEKNFEARDRRFTVGCLKLLVDTGVSRRARTASINLLRHSLLVCPDVIPIM